MNLLDRLLQAKKEVKKVDCGEDLYVKKWNAADRIQFYKLQQKVKENATSLDFVVENEIALAMLHTVDKDGVIVFPLDRIEDVKNLPGELIFRLAIEGVAFNTVSENIEKKVSTTSCDLPVDSVSPLAE